MCRFGLVWFTARGWLSRLDRSRVCKARLKGVQLVLVGPLASKEPGQIHPFVCLPGIGVGPTLSTLTTPLSRSLMLQHASRVRKERIWISFLGVHAAFCCFEDRGRPMVSSRQQYLLLIRWEISATRTSCEQASLWLQWAAATPCLRLLRVALFVPTVCINTLPKYS